MIRKLLCWLGFHEWDVEVVRSNVDGPECCISYNDEDDTLRVMMAMNFKCKHCKKHLGSKVIIARFPANELGIKVSYAKKGRATK